MQCNRKRILLTDVHQLMHILIPAYSIRLCAISIADTFLKLREVLSHSNTIFLWKLYEVAIRFHCPQWIECFIVYAGQPEKCLKSLMYVCIKPLMQWNRSESVACWLDIHVLYANIKTTGSNKSVEALCSACCDTAHWYQFPSLGWVVDTYNIKLWSVLLLLIWVILRFSGMCLLVGVIDKVMQTVQQYSHSGLFQLLGFLEFCLHLLNQKYFQILILCNRMPSR